jgi:hypothetical protein
MIMLHSSETVGQNIQTADPVVRTSSIALHWIHYDWLLQKHWLPQNYWLITSTLLIDYFNIIDWLLQADTVRATLVKLAEEFNKKHTPSPRAITSNPVMLSTQRTISSPGLNKRAIITPESEHTRSATVSSGSVPVVFGASRSLNRYLFVLVAVSLISTKAQQIYFDENTSKSSKHRWWVWNDSITF